MAEHNKKIQPVQSFFTMSRRIRPELPLSHKKIAQNVIFSNQFRVHYTQNAETVLKQGRIKFKKKSGRRTKKPKTSRTHKSVCFLVPTNVEATVGQQCFWKMMCVWVGSLYRFYEFFGRIKYFSDSGVVQKCFCYFLE